MIRPYVRLWGEAAKIASSAAVTPSERSIYAVAPDVTGACQAGPVESWLPPLSVSPDADALKPCRVSDAARTFEDDRLASFI